ncbi:DNA-binding protein [Gordonia sp. p3-SID1431]|uniref:DNA-binding protein n=1 Tax=Gordonia sp. p3-SID1431 TaxID=2916159 RepID=UPI0021A571BB|nr:DNA-binding protein [Gordonia sp. p3-SID1431]MCT1355484.1 DNA-binding protein [Gordonia sp. p3-SID1431]
MSTEPHLINDLRVFRKAEVGERLAISEDSVDAPIAAGKLRTLCPRKKVWLSRCPARSLREYIYGKSG